MNSNSATLRPVTVFEHDKHDARMRDLTEYHLREIIADSSIAQKKYPKDELKHCLLARLAFRAARELERRSHRLPLVAA